MKTFISFVFLLTTISLSATVYTENYSGGLIGNWTNPNSWSPIGIHGASDTVIILNDTIVVDEVISVSRLILQGGALKLDSVLTVTNRFDYSGGVIRGAKELTVLGEAFFAGNTKYIKTKVFLQGKSQWNQGNIELQANPDEGGEANPDEGGEVFLMADTLHIHWADAVNALFVHSGSTYNGFQINGSSVFLKSGPGALTLDGDGYGFQTNGSNARVKIEDGPLNNGCGNFLETCQGSGDNSTGGGGSGPSGTPGQDCDTNEGADTGAAKRVQKGHIEVEINASFLLSHAYEFTAGSSISGNGKMYVKYGYLDYKSNIPLSVDSLTITNGSIVKGNGIITSKKVGLTDATLSGSLSLVCDRFTMDKAYLVGSGTTTINNLFTLNSIIGNSINRTIVLKNLGNWNTSKVSFTKRGKIKIDPSAKLYINTNGSVIEYRHGAGPVIEVLGELEQTGQGGKLNYKIATGESGGGFINVGAGAVAKGCVDCDATIGGGGGGCPAGCSPGEDDDDEDDDGMPDGPVNTDCGVDTMVLNEIKGHFIMPLGSKLILNNGFTVLDSSGIIDGPGRITNQGRSYLTLDGGVAELAIDNIGKGTVALNTCPNTGLQNLELDGGNARYVINAPCYAGNVLLNTASLIANADVTLNNLTVNNGNVSGAGNINALGKIKWTGTGIMKGSGVMTSVDSLILKNVGMTVKKPIVVNGPMLIQHYANVGSSLYIEKNGGLGTITVPVGKELVLHPPGVQLINTSDMLIVVDSFYNPFKIYGTLRKIGARKNRIINGGIEIKDGAQLIVEQGSLKWGGVTNHGNGSIVINDGSDAELYSLISTTSSGSPHVQTFAPGFSLTGNGNFKISGESKADFLPGIGMISVDSILVGNVGGSNTSIKSQKQISNSNLIIKSNSVVLLTDSCTFKSVTMNSNGDTLQCVKDVLITGNFEWKLGTLLGPGSIYVQDTLNMDYPNSGILRILQTNLYIQHFAAWKSAGIFGGGMVHVLNNAEMKITAPATSNFYPNLKIYTDGLLSKTSGGETIIFSPYSIFEGNLSLNPGSHLKFYSVGSVSRWNGPNVFGSGSIIFDYGHTANVVAPTNFGISILKLSSANATLNDSIGNSFGGLIMSNGYFKSYAPSSFAGLVGLSGGIIGGSKSQFILKNPAFILSSITLSDSISLVVDSMLTWFDGSINSADGSLEKLIINQGAELKNDYGPNSQNCNVAIINKGFINKTGSGTIAINNSPNSYLDLEGGTLHIYDGTLKLGRGNHNLNQVGLVFLSAPGQLSYDPNGLNDTLVLGNGFNCAGNGKLVFNGNGSINPNSFITSKLEVKSKTLTNNFPISPKELIVSGSSARYHNTARTGIDKLNFVFGTLSGTDTIVVTKEAQITGGNKLSTVLKVDSIAVLTGSFLNESTTLKGTIEISTLATFSINVPSGTNTSIQPQIINRGILSKLGVNKITTLTGRLTNCGTINVDATGSFLPYNNRLELANGLPDNMFKTGSIITGNGMFLVKAGTGIVVE